MVLRAYADSAPWSVADPVVKSMILSLVRRVGWVAAYGHNSQKQRGSHFNVVLFTYIFTDLASSRLTSGFALALERAMEAMPKRRSALAMVRALLSLAPQDCKKGSLESCASN